MEHPAIKKVASRFLLPLEIYLGITAIAWAFTGGFGHGILRALLETAQHKYLDDVWFATLTAIGVAQASAALIEWIYGRTWTLETVWRSARVRCTVAFVAVLAWTWVIKLLLDVGPLNVTIGLIIIAPATIAMQVWVYWENIRVRLAADNSIPTSTMIFKR
jgi:hypothetical protein